MFIGFNSNINNTIKKGGFGAETQKWITGTTSTLFYSF